jgi:hypothetical protein
MLLSKAFSVPSSPLLDHSLQLSRNAMKAFPQPLGPSHRIECVGVWQECVLMIDQTRGIVRRQIHHFFHILVHFGGPRLQEDRLLVAAGKAIGNELNVKILELHPRYVFWSTVNILEHLSHTVFLGKGFQQPSWLKGVRKSVIVETGEGSPMVREIHHG